MKMRQPDRTGGLLPGNDDHTRDAADHDVRHIAPDNRSRCSPPLPADVVEAAAPNAWCPVDPQLGGLMMLTPRLR